ncbi:hypothetical protein EB796_003217 [Bugula neritina]|uniref:Protein sleepless n=1 Tax=Bugula neritina TaxID=10212 RepID=A0A7J7KKG5_BUGNE|nr:hypothetical protein EB796_003217 [Bugula neritina]
MNGSCLFLNLFILLSFTGSISCTLCYVCGEKSALAEMCVDEYSYDMRALHTKDCSQEFGHTKGCMKSKYVDPEGNQIVSRSCAPKTGMHADNECKSTEVSNTKVYFCHCPNDYCNTSVKATARFSLLLVLMLMLRLY